MGSVDIYLLLAWTICWTNNRVTSDMRRHDWFRSNSLWHLHTGSGLTPYGMFKDWLLSDTLPHIYRLIPVWQLMACLPIDYGLTLYGMLTYWFQSDILWHVYRLIPLWHIMACLQIDSGLTTYGMFTYWFLSDILWHVHRLIPVWHLTVRCQTGISL